MLLGTATFDDILRYRAFMSPFDRSTTVSVGFLSFDGTPAHVTHPPNPTATLCNPSRAFPHLFVRVTPQQSDAVRSTWRDDDWRRSCVVPL
jgi:hypothetical protein